MHTAIVKNNPRFRGRKVSGTLPEMQPEDHHGDIALEILDVASGIDGMKQVLVAATERGCYAGAIEAFLCNLKKTEVELEDLYKKVVGGGLTPQRPLIKAFPLKCMPERMAHWKKIIRQHREIKGATA
jgi:hypothetical protein